MKQQIRRNIFETNSSSTHSIVIGNNGQDIYKELPEKLEFHGGEFGWEHETYYDTQSKANYLYTSIVWCGGEIDVDDAIDRIRKILAKWDIEAEFEKLNENGEFYGWSYVDHGYENKDLVKELITNEELLMNYLFSENSSVETGNDNDDTEFTAEQPKNILFDYYKGN